MSCTQCNKCYYYATNIISGLLIGTLCVLLYLILPATLRENITHFPNRETGVQWGSVVVHNWMSRSVPLESPAGSFRECVVIWALV